VTALIVALVLVGASLLVAEAHVVSYGVLGVAGVALLATAGVLAIETAGGGAVLAVAVVLPIAAVLLGLMLVAGRKALAVSRRRPANGLVGSVGVVRSAISPEGHVAVAGELWRARRSWVDDAEPTPGVGDHVVVESVHGLTLSVRRAEEWELMP
jgi:membrane-bound ClpP family serine protease